MTAEVRKSSLKRKGNIQKLRSWHPIFPSVHGWKMRGASGALADLLADQSAADVCSHEVRHSLENYDQHGQHIQKQRRASSKDRCPAMRVFQWCVWMGELD